MMRWRAKGVITVYLSLVLVIVLALLTTTLEGARLSGFRYMADSMSELVSESVLADYNDLLFDRYHVFGKTIIDGTEKQREEYVQAELKKYLGKNLNSDGAFLWNFNSVQAEAGECPSLVDYDGAFFRQQAADYMKYRAAGLALEKILSILDIFSKTEDQAKLISQKQEAEQALAEIDKRVLKLIENVDGIRCDENGIKRTLTGGVSTASNFVKKFFVGTPTMGKAKINNGSLYSAVEKLFENPEKYIEDMQSSLDEFEENRAKLEQNEQEILLYERQLEQSEKLSESLALEAKLLAVKAENATITIKLGSNEKSYQKACSDLKKLVDNCWEACMTGLSVLGEIKKVREESAAAIYAYESQLSEAEAWLDPTSYNEYLQELEEMKAYLGKKVPGIDHIPDFEGMDLTLKKNRDLLADIDKKLSENESLEQAMKHKGLAEELKDLCKQYSFEALRIDYTGINLTKNKFNPFDTVERLVAEGISGLVLAADEQVSKKQHTFEDFPSDASAVSIDKNENNLFYQTSLSNLLGASPLGQVKELLAHGALEIGEKALFLGYLNDNFSSFAKKTEEESVCDYELEYILCGRETDKQNLNSVISRILLTRLVFCFIHVLSDSEKTTPAEQVATSILGFTGVPMLAQALKYIILFVWAFDEALVETAALLRGKKVDIIPTKENFQVSFAEIFLMGKQAIDEKAEARPASTGLALDYSGYLTLFLLLQKVKDQTLRCMDVVQENLRLSEDSFRMTAMLYGFTATYEFELPPVFGSMPFSTVLLGRKYRYTVIGGAKY